MVYSSYLSVSSSVLLPSDAADVSSLRRSCREIRKKKKKEGPHTELSLLAHLLPAESVLHRSQSCPGACQRSESGDRQGKAKEGTAKKECKNIDAKNARNETRRSPRRYVRHVSYADMLACANCAAR